MRAWISVSLDWAWKVVSVIIIPVAWWMHSNVVDLKVATRELGVTVRTLSESRVTRDEFAGLLRSIDACALKENVPRRSDLDNLSERVLNVERRHERQDH
jgi:hypothetical protein